MTSAQVRSVSVDTNGAVVAPANFFQVNSNILNAAVGAGSITGLAAGNGLVKVGGTFYFARTNAYTIGLIPYATGADTIGFNAGLQFFPNQGNLVVAGDVSGTSISAQDGLFQGTLSRGFSPVVTENYDILTSGSLTGGGNLSATRTHTLVNDSASPGNSKYYGTDGTGSKGFFPLTLGTVTSVNLTLPSWLTVSGGPITTAGTFAVTPTGGQSANQVVATPDGVAGGVAPRSLVAGDIPSLDAAKITSGTMATARLGSGTANSTTFLRGDQSYTQVADAQVSSSAAIAKSKISTGSTWAAADIPTTLNTTTFPNVVITPTSLTYAATTDIDLSGNGFRTLSLTGNITFTTSNRAAGETVSVKILCDSSARNFTFPSWHFIGAAAPASIAASKTAVLTVTCFGTLDTDCVAAYAVEP